jgi:hypothetical protein
MRLDRWDLLSPLFALALTALRRVLASVQEPWWSLWEAEAAQ